MNEKTIQTILIVAIIAVVGGSAFAGYKILRPTKTEINNNAVTSQIKNSVQNSNLTAQTSTPTTKSTNQDIWLSITSDLPASGIKDSDLSSFNESTKTFTVARQIPTQGPATLNIIQSPQNGKMTFYKFVGDRRQIFWSSTNGEQEQLVDEGDDTSGQPVWLEALSSDGRYVLYAKGTKSVQMLYDSIAKTTSTLDLPKLEGDTGIFPLFSSSGKYLSGLTDGESGKFFAAWSYNLETKKLIKVNIHAEDNPNTVRLSPDDRWLVISTQDGSTNYEKNGPVLTKIELVDIQNEKYAGEISIENNQKNFSSIIWLGPSTFVVRTSNGQAGSVSVLQSKFFLVTITNRVMTSKEIYTDPEHVRSSEMFGHGTGSVILGQVALDAQAKQKFMLTKVMVDGSSEELFSANDNKAYILLNDEPLPPAL